MTNYRNYSNLATDPMTASVYARLADLRDEAARPEGARRSGFAMAGARAALQRFVSAQPEYSGPAYLRA